MKKHTIKAFVTSFCVSLFAMHVASNAFSYKKPQKDIKVIPSKNIALFFNSAPQANANPVKKIKKIALSIAPTPAPKAEIKEEIMPLISVAKLEEAKDIPLQYTNNTPKIEDIAKDIPLMSEETPLQKIKKDTPLKKELVYAPKKVATPPIEEAAQIQVSEKKQEPEPLIPLTKSKELIFNGNATLKETPELSNKVAQNSQTTFATAEKSLKTTVEDVVVLEKTTPWIEMKNVKKDELADAQKASQEQQLPQAQSPWAVAKSVVKPTNKLQPTQKEEPKEEDKKPLQNILIPLPDDFKDSAKKPPLITQNPIIRSLDAPEDIKENSSPIKEDEKDADIPKEQKKEGRLLKNIASLFSKEKDDTEETAEEKQELPKAIAKLAEKKEILPSEIRLVFAPNRVEISGQTLTWLSAFAQKSKEEDVALEIRASGTASPDLQQKRLNLIYNILASKRVEPQKVETYFTNRDQNSFIIRIKKINKERISSSSQKNIINSAKLWY